MKNIPNSLMFLAVMISALAMIIILEAPDASAARSGPQANPPSNGDWIINTTGNSIDNETLVYGTTGGDEPKVTVTANSITLKGNLIVEAGGELNLSDVWIEFDTDADNLLHITVEDGGTLSIYNTTFSPDGSVQSDEEGNQMFGIDGPDIDYVDIDGNLSHGGPVDSLGFWHVKNNITIQRGHSYIRFKVTPGPDQGVSRTTELRIGGESSFLDSDVYLVETVVFEDDVISLVGTGFWDIGKLAIPHDTLIKTSTLRVENFTFLGEQLLLINSSLDLYYPFVLDSQELVMEEGGQLRAERNILMARDSVVTMENVKLKADERVSDVTGIGLEGSILTMRGSLDVDGELMASTRVWNGILVDAVDSEVYIDTVEIWGHSENFSRSLQAFSLRNSELSLKNSDVKHLQEYMLTADDDSRVIIENCSFGLDNTTFWYQVPVAGMLLNGANTTLLNNSFQMMDGDLIHSHGDLYLSGNYVFNVTGDLITYDGSSGGTLFLENNNITMVGGHGIHIVDAPDVVLHNNTLVQLSGNAIHLENSPGATITENTIFDLDSENDGITTYGIFMDHAPTSVIHRQSYVADNHITGAEHGGYDIYAIKEQPHGWAENLSECNSLGSHNRAIQKLYVSFLVLDESEAPRNDTYLNASHEILINGTPHWTKDFGRMTLPDGTVPEMVAIQYEIIADIGSGKVISHSPQRLNLTRSYPSGIVVRNTTFVNLVRNGLYTVELPRSPPDFHLVNMFILNDRVAYREGRPRLGYSAKNYGEIAWKDVPFHGYYRPVGDTGEWLPFQSDSITFSSIGESGGASVNGVVEWFDTPERGEYNVSFIIDPGDVAGDTDPLNNILVLPGVLDIRVRPTISITSPLFDENISGTVEIRGTVTDFYDSIDSSNQIDLFIEVDGAMEKIDTNDLFLEGESALQDTLNWSHTWKTNGTADFSTTNGQVRISAQCRNREVDFKRSDFFNITVTVHNVPYIKWNKPDLEDEKPFISGRVKDLGKNNMGELYLRVDDGGLLEDVLVVGGTGSKAWEYEWSDIADYSDGLHTFHASTSYDAGGYFVDIGDSYIVDINSPGEQTRPQLTFDYNHTSTQLVGNAWDDNGITGVEVSLNGGKFVAATDESVNASWWEWSHQIDLAGLPVGFYTIDIRASDGWEYVEKTIESDNPRRYDLGITDLRVDVTEATEGESVLVLVGVKNTGPHASHEGIEVELTFFDGGVDTSLYRDSEPFSLAPGEQRTIRVNWTAAKGVDEIKATVNPVFINKETDTSNNEDTVSIKVNAKSGTGDDDENTEAISETLSGYLPIILVLLVLGIVIPVALSYFKSRAKEREMAGISWESQQEPSTDADGIVDFQELERGGTQYGGMPPVRTEELLPSPTRTESLIPESLYEESMRDELEEFEELVED